MSNFIPTGNTLPHDLPAVLYRTDTTWSDRRPSSSYSNTTSRSTSPCPSLSSATSSHTLDDTMLEIEELSDSDTTVNALHGEFEEAPEHPVTYDDDEEEIIEGVESIDTEEGGLQGSWRRLRPGTKKRSHDESDEEVEYASDWSTDSNRSARRRKMAGGRALQVPSLRATPEYMETEMD